VIDLYKDYHIYRTDPIVYNAADERGERGLIKTELFVTNYDIADAVIEQVKVKMKKGRTKIDIFVEKKQGDNRIDFPGCIGLEKIN
jgi:hypothetical protein